MTPRPSHPPTGERDPRAAGSGRPSPRQRVVWGLGLVAPLWLLWLALNGGAAWAEGLAAAAVAALAGAWLAPGRPHPWRPLQLLSFAGFFVLASLRGGIDVAARALHPRLPVDPAWIEHRLWLPDGQPRTLMLSVTNLLPGTLAAEVEPATGVLHVHLLARDVDPRLDELQMRLGALFGLRPPSR